VGDRPVMLAAIILSLVLWGVLAMIAYAIYLAVA
jgi:uncharacterized membrane protein YbhN (UPF0104 family)